MNLDAPRLNCCFSKFSADADWCRISESSEDLDDLKYAESLGLVDNLTDRNRPPKGSTYFEHWILNTRGRLWLKTGKYKT